MSNLTPPQRTTLLTPSDCSRIAQGALTPAAFRAAAARGRLRIAAITVGGVHLFAQDDVERYIAEREQRRRGAGA
jgi:hypothetical protein